MTTGPEPFCLCEENLADLDSMEPYAKPRFADNIVVIYQCSEFYYDFDSMWDLQANQQEIYEDESDRALTVA